MTLSSNIVADRLRASRRLVIKLGTSTVTGAEGEVCLERITPIVRSIVALKDEGRQVVLVSSGAVGLGAGRLGLSRSRLNDLVVRQACAAVGQSLLMATYGQLFATHNLKIAQVLLTEEDFADRSRCQNLRGTMEKLLKFGVLPIVNENDTVSTAELEYRGTSSFFGDNDRLAALVMSKLESEALILLTDVEGLMTSKDQGDIIPLVEVITPELRLLASGPAVGGRGGMLSKLDAAELAMRSGGIAVIASGRADTVERLFAGEQIGTTFVSTSRMHGKRRWIAYAANVRGRVIVNSGARDAIVNGKGSLLTSGVIRIEQEFAPSDVVSIVDAEGHEFARGMASRASSDTVDASTRKSGVLVMRDNIVIMA
ncbi:MAG TPA: glutamate 5-kinase [Pyrinomonadaceae bacterium]|jgi:glutamate 5-kinase|nr:glutamate 5-kinase [Pyrinomonadaceae bacterium]